MEMATTKRSKRANEKDKRAVTAHLAGKSQPKAMIEAGFSKSYANDHPQDYFERPAIKSLMTEALQKVCPGIVEKAAKVVSDALAAKKAVVVSGGQGCGSDIEYVDDIPTRLQAVDRVNGAFGFIPKTQDLPEPARPPIAIHFHISGSEKPKVKVVDLKASEPPKTKPFTFKIRTPVKA